MGHDCGQEASNAFGEDGGGGWSMGAVMGGKKSWCQIL